MSTLFDRGAQNERTRLAWQRTLLSMTLCALVVSRLVASRQLTTGVLVAVAALGLAVVLAALTRRRYAAAQDALHGTRSLPDARLPLVMVLLLGLIGVGAVALLLTWS